MLQTNIVMLICMTLDSVITTQSSVIQNIHCNVGLKFFFAIFPKMFVRYYCYVCMFQSLIFHKVVCRRIYCVMGYIIITLLQIVCRVRQWKNFENRSIIGEDMDKSKVAHFSAHPLLHSGAPHFLPSVLMPFFQHLLNMQWAFIGMTLTRQYINMFSWIVCFCLTAYQVYFMELILVHYNCYQ